MQVELLLEDQELALEEPLLEEQEDQEVQEELVELVDQVDQEEHQPSRLSGSYS